MEPLRPTRMRHLLAPPTHRLLANGSGGRAVLWSRGVVAAAPPPPRRCAFIAPCAAPARPVLYEWGLPTGLGVRWGSPRGPLVLWPTGAYIPLTVLWVRGNGRVPFGGLYLPPPRGWKQWGDPQVTPPERYIVKGTLVEFCDPTA